MFDCVIMGGLVVDGTGAPPFSADIAIRDGRIVEIGVVTGGARETIDAAGAIVTPGFIDIHTHYDGQFLWDPEARTELLQRRDDGDRGQLRRRLRARPGREPQGSDRHHGGGRGHPRHRAGRRARLVVGKLPRLSRQACRAAVHDGRGDPRHPRAAARVRDGRAGDAARAGNRGRSCRDAAHRREGMAARSAFPPRASWSTGPPPARMCPAPSPRIAS